MAYFLTLVSMQNGPPHDEISNHLKIKKPWNWLSQNKAAEIQIENLLHDNDLQILHTLCEESQTDIFITPATHRRKKLLLADMDSTIVQGETLDDLAAHAGIKDQITAITARAMNGELDFHDALRERVALLKNLSAKALDKTLQTTCLNKGAKTLVRTMKAHGATCILISGGFTFFTRSIANQVGFDHHHGNHLDIQNNRLTGQVIDPILDKDSKHDFLKTYAQNLSLNLSETMTIGDGANDLAMLLAAHNAKGLGIGYKPKPAVAAQLENIIRHTDLTAALYAQGFRQDEIIF